MADPVAVWSGEFVISGVTLHCHVLDDGMRIIDAGDLTALFLAWEQGADAPGDDGIEAFARWQRGEDGSGG